VAFSYDDKMENSLESNREYNVVEALTNDLRINYSTSVFEDE